MMSRTKTENWLHRWGLNLAMLTLLGIIVWGGREFINEIRAFQKEQRKMNIEIKEANATFREKCVSADFKITTNSNVNQTQGVTLMKYGEALIKHETEIEHLKDN